MKLAVFGATGGLGREVVKSALTAGHTVRAMARDASKLRSQAVDVTIGDLSQSEAIRSTIEGTEAVISCIGVSKGGDPEAFGVGMQSILDAMHEHRVNRLIAISGAGLELEGDASGFGRRFIITMLKLFARDVLRGKELEWDVIRASKVDWTLVRVARMAERPAAGSVKTDLHRVSGSPMVAYADVATWMVHEASAREFVCKAPFVSGA